MKIVISASRRTDIPAFYMNWFMQQIEQGFFEVINPYNRKATVVPATPDKVHTIVFWSKNFGPFIEGGYGQTLVAMGYNLFFNFTINSDSSLLEPRMPPLKERCQQLDMLCQMFDAQSVTWRFDPICFYVINEAPRSKERGFPVRNDGHFNKAPLNPALKGGACGKQSDQVNIHNNLHDFALIADRAFHGGVSRCITSFMDDYPKIRKRVARLPGFAFIDPPLATKRKILLDIKKTLAAKNIDLFTCCEKQVLETLPDDARIKPSACIPNRLLVDLFGGNLSFKKDAGQRIKDGCGCMVSVDIGSYRLHPCYHNCLFCYANPSPENKTNENRFRNP